MSENYENERWINLTESDCYNTLKCNKKIHKEKVYK